MELRIYRTLMMMLTGILLLTGCTEEARESGSTSGKALRFKVQDANAAGTRATMDGMRAVTFQPGDAIGLYVVQNGTVIQANVKVTYTEGANAAAGETNDSPEWQAAETVESNTAYTYFAYYPWRDDINLSDLNLATTSAAAFFQGYRNRYTFWSSDQSTPEKLMACDFMVAHGVPVKEDVTDEGYLLLNMEHQMALVQLKLQKRRDVERTAVNTTIKYTTQNGYSWTSSNENVNEKNLVEMAASSTFYGNLPCRCATGQYYFIAKPDEELSFATSHHEDEETLQVTGSWTQTLTAPSAGKYLTKEVMTDETAYTQQWLVDERDYVMALGDIVGSDGSLWKPTNTSTKGPDATPIAMVIKTSYDYDDGTESYQHGMALGLKELCGTLSGNEGRTASTIWATVDNAIICEDAVLTPTWEANNTPTSTIYQYVTNPNGGQFTISGETITIEKGQNGLANTKAVMAACAEDMTRVPVFKALADDYPLVAFSGSSGWFIPSVSELYYLFITFTGVNQQNFVSGTTSNRWLRYTGSNASSVISSIHTYLDKMGAGNYDAFYGISTNTRYWCSTESTESAAYNVLVGTLNNTAEVRFDGGYSKTSNLTCRVFLAF